MAQYGTYKSPGGFKLTLYAILVLIGFCFMLYLVRGMYHQNQVGGINPERAAERKKARIELTAKAEELLRNGARDTNTGAIRLPISRAMELTLEAYKTPGKLQSDLTARVERASAPPPQKPSEFE